MKPGGIADVRRQGTLPQNPIAAFLDESKCIQRVGCVARFASNYARLSNVVRSPANQIHIDRGILLQCGRAATQEPAVTDVLRGAHFLEWFFIAIDSAQLQHDSQANAHFTSPLGPSGAQHVCQAGSQRVKVNRFLEIRRGAELLAE